MQYINRLSRFPSLVLPVLLGAYYASWAVRGGFAWPTWVAMFSLVYVLKLMGERNDAFPDRYIQFFRLPTAAPYTQPVLLTMVAFTGSVASIAALFIAG